MWSFSTNDLADGATEKVVAASDFRGPRRKDLRVRTDTLCFPILFIGLVFCGYCFIAPYAIRDPNFLKLLQGTDYAGELGFKERKQTCVLALSPKIILS